MHLILNMHHCRSGQCLYKLSNTHTLSIKILKHAGHSSWFIFASPTLPRGKVITHMHKHTPVKLNHYSVYATLMVIPTLSQCWVHFVLPLAEQVIYMPAVTVIIC